MKDDTFLSMMVIERKISANHVWTMQQTLSVSAR